MVIRGFPPTNQLTTYVHSENLCCYQLTRSIIKKSDWTALKVTNKKVCPVVWALFHWSLIINWLSMLAFADITILDMWIIEQKILILILQNNKANLYSDKRRMNGTHHIFKSQCLTSTEWNFSSDQCCSVQKNIPARVGLSCVCVSAARVPISRSPDSSVVCSQLLGWLQRMALMPTPARAPFSDSLCLHDSVQRCLWKIHKWNIFTQVNRSQQRFLMIPSYASGLNVIHMNAHTGSANRLWNHIFRAGTIWGHHGNFTQWLSGLPQWSTPNYLHCYGNIQLSLISVIFLFHPWALKLLEQRRMHFFLHVYSISGTHIYYFSLRFSLAPIENG